MDDARTPGEPVTDTAQIGSTEAEEAVVFDGTNIEALPVSVQELLARLPEEVAHQVQEGMVGRTMAEIENDMNPSFFGNGPWAKGPSRMPGPFQPAAPYAPYDPWPDTKTEIAHIAEMFKTLTEAGMPPEMAMRVIETRAPQHNVACAVPRRAGARVEAVYPPGPPINSLGSHFGATIVGNGDNSR